MSEACPAEKGRVIAIDGKPLLRESARSERGLRAPHETLDKGHRGIETRRCLAVGELDWLGLPGLKARWPKLPCVACIESTREVTGRVETEKRFVISSLSC
ncbi:MAG: hypothetical protein JNK92_07845 [Dechloromonas sp.]|nr:hypothetical protein [Dechloromonas sp.]